MEGSRINPNHWDRQNKTAFQAKCSLKKSLELNGDTQFCLISPVFKETGLGFKLHEAVWKAESMRGT